MWQSQYFERFYYFNFEKKYHKIENIFKNLEKCFFVKSAKIENVMFWYKTAMSEANVKTNGIKSAKWTVNKKWSFAG